MQNEILLLSDQRQNLFEIETLQRRNTIVTLWYDRTGCVEKTHSSILTLGSMIERRTGRLEGLLRLIQPR